MHGRARASVSLLARTRLASWAPVLILALLGLGLRALRLGFQPLWWDEGYSVWFATHPLGQMAALTAEDIHPPLYYALLHGWSLLAGPGAVALRLFSVVVGTLAIPAVYLAGVRLLGRRAAWLAALLLAFNPLHVYYSQEIRMYGLVALLSASTLAAAATILGLNRSHDEAADLPPVRTFVPYVLLVTAALYTQYYAVFLPLGLTFFALWRWHRRPAALVRWLVAQAVAALLYVPWLLYATPRLIPYVSQKVQADADRPLALLPYLARHFAAFIAGHLEGPLAPGWPWSLALLLPGALALGLWIRHRRVGVWQPGARRAAVWLLLAVLGIALVGGYAISRRYPFFPQRGERLLLVALPPFVLLVGAVLDALWRRVRWAAVLVLGLAVAVAVASLLAFYTVPRYAGDDYRPLLARIVEQGGAEDTVFCVYPWQVGYWRSYLGDRGLSTDGGPQALLSPAPAWGPRVADALDSALARGHVWFPAHLALGAILESRIETHMAQVSRPFFNQWYGPATRLSGWSRDVGEVEEPVNLAPVYFSLPGGAGGELVLEGVSAAPRVAVPADNAVTPLTLSWRAAAPPPDLAASVRLVDDLGQIWAQHDYEPLGGGAARGQGEWHGRDRIGLLLPAGTPPGQYRVEVTVRTKDEGTALEAFGPASTKRGIAAPLFSLTVAPPAHPLGAERLPLERQAPADLGDGLQFLGFSGMLGPVVPGAELKVNLFWGAVAAPQHDYVAFVQLLGQPGHPPVAGWEAAPGASYPTNRWAPGTLMRTQAGLRPPADLPDGQYVLIAGLFRRSDGQRLHTRGGADHVTLGRVTVRGRPHQTQAPHPAHAADATFAPFARLVGYDLSGVEPARVAPGDGLLLTLHWQALASADRPYTVFVHLTDPATGTLFGSGDGEPGGGRWPATGWVAGEYLADAHTVTVEPRTPAGTYRLAVGLYDPATGQRLVLPDGSDQFLLDSQVIVR